LGGFDLFCALAIGNYWRFYAWCFLSSIYSSFDELSRKIFEKSLPTPSGGTLQAKE
jgi:hypothetical protein